MTSAGLTTTFQVLAESPGSSATRVLARSLDSPYAYVREQAFETLLVRHDDDGHLALIARYDTFGPGELAALRQNRGRILGGIRQAIVSSSERTFENGCRAAIDLDEFDLIPTLISAIESPSTTFQKRYEAAFDSLVRALQLQWRKHFTSAWGTSRRANDQSTADQAKAENTDANDSRLNPDGELTRARRAVLNSLRDSLKRYSDHRNRHIVNAYLLLCPMQEELLERLLSDALAPTFPAVSEFLQNDESESVQEIVRHRMTSARAPVAVLTTLSKRQDLEFLEPLLDFLQQNWSRPIELNCKRLRQVSWLEDKIDLLPRMDEAAQVGALQIALHSGLSQLAKFRVTKLLLLDGKPEARRDAALALSEFHGTEANSLMTEALTDEDPAVQAAVVPQLRDRGIPGGLSHLIDFAASPHAEVRYAVGRAMPEFQFGRFWDAYPHLSEEVRETTADMVRRLDPEAKAKLVLELQGGISSRQLQAVRIAMLMGMVDEVESELISLAKTGEIEVKAEAIHALGYSRSERSLKLLKDIASKTVNGMTPLMVEMAEQLLAMRGTASNEAARPQTTMEARNGDVSSSEESPVQVPEKS